MIINIFNILYCHFHNYKFSVLLKHTKRPLWHSGEDVEDSILRGLFTQLYTGINTHTGIYTLLAGVTGIPRCRGLFTPINNPGQFYSTPLIFIMTLPKPCLPKLIHIGDNVNEILKATGAKNFF